MANREIEKIVVLNKELPLIYIKKDLLNESGPHYTMVIESVKAFENEIQMAQHEFALDDRIEIQYEYRTDWSKLFSWILPIFGIIILFWLLWPTIKRKVAAG